jgi:DNA-binding winged helix-turn-helix (wHTH) protein
MQDPVTAAWCAHLKARPLPEGQHALFLRRWLARDGGERPGDVQAACWLDIKRIYMQMRPTLRRVYLPLVDVEAYQPVATKLGFELLGTAPVALDGGGFHSVVLDFGPRSVDGWLSDLAAAELGIEAKGSLLDERSREIVHGDARVELTPLEFGLLRYLMEREGEAVSREALLHDVWENVATTASNVVDAVVTSVRRKLGPESHRIQTVRGLGYRYRAEDGARGLSEEEPGPPGGNSTRP